MAKSKSKSSKSTKVAKAPAKTSEKTKHVTSSASRSEKKKSTATKEVVTKNSKNSKKKQSTLKAGDDKTKNSKSIKKHNQGYKRIKRTKPKNILAWMALPFLVVWDVVRRTFKHIVRSTKNFMRRRPHRSFRRTRRRDYVRSLKLPGYFAFTMYVTSMIWQRKWTFIPMAFLFMVLTVLFGLLGSQDVYSQLTQIMQATAPKEVMSGVFGEVGKAGILLFTSITQGLQPQLDPGQQIIAGFMSLYVWLTVVWLMRNYLAGKKVKLRDGLYSAGSPILATFLTFIILLIQLVPMAFAVIVASAAWQSGIVDTGVESMMAAFAVLLVITLSMYWVTSTFFALVIVTLPGMYPIQALVIAGDLVIGRRLRLLYRIIWMFLVVFSWWFVIMVPVIILDAYLKKTFEFMTNWPVVPLFLLAVTTFTIIWVASYIYLLYRKVVDDDAAPA